MTIRVTARGGQGWRQGWKQEAGVEAGSKGGAINFDRKGNSNKPMNGSPSKRDIDIVMKSFQI